MDATTTPDHDLANTRCLCGHPVDCPVHSGSLSSPSSLSAERQRSLDTLPWSDSGRYGRTWEAAWKDLR